MFQAPRWQSGYRPVLVHGIQVFHKLNVLQPTRLLLSRIFISQDTLYLPIFSPIHSIINREQH